MADAPDLNPTGDIAYFANALITDNGLNWLSNQINPEWANPSQALAMRAYHEAAQEFIRYQRRLDSTRIEIMRAGLPIPPDLHLRFYGEVRDFYRAFYDVMERLMKVAVLYESAFSTGTHPPRRGVERFIEWLEEQQFATEHWAWMLRKAHEFRTALTHSNTLPAWDWGTFEIEADDGSPITLVQIIGTGPVPAHGYEHEPHDEHLHTWHVLPPVDSTLIRAFVCTVQRVFSRITGHQMMNEGHP